MTVHRFTLAAVKAKVANYKWDAQIVSFRQTSLARRDQWCPDIIVYQPKHRKGAHKLETSSLLPFQQVIIETNQHDHFTICYFQIIMETQLITITYVFINAVNAANLKSKLFCEHLKIILNNRADANRT